VEARDEILRLRDRYHELSNAHMRLEGKVEQLEIWRGELLGELREWRRDLQKWHDDVQSQLDTLGDELEGLMKADEIADAVAAGVSAAMQQRNKLELTLLQKLGAGVAGILALLVALHSLGVHL
jgi:chromosome segregation ATPase